MALGLFAASLGAQTTTTTATPPAAEEDVVTLEKFSVQDRITDPSIAVGADKIRNTVAITREALLSAPAGYSGLKMLESLPGFNVQTADALGMYEFGNSVFVRAFNYGQIAFSLDGIPMGRSAQFGGSPIYRYVENENIGQVSANPGSGDVSFAGYNSLGPSAAYYTIAPSKSPGAAVAVTLGTHDQERSMIKLQSGEFNGLSAYISRSKNESTQWRGGAGGIDREHIDAKIRYEFGAGNSLQFTYAWNDYFDWDSPSISKAVYATSGRYYGYLKDLPNLAPSAAYPTVAYSNSGYTNYYLQAVNSRNDALYGLSGTVHVGDALSIETTAYFDDKKGFGASFADYSSSLSIYNAQVAAGVTGLTAPKGVQYGVSYIANDRRGLNTKATYKVANHTIVGGFWVERDDYWRRRLRNNLEGGNPNGAILHSEIVNKLLDFKSVNDTTQIYLKDTVTLLDDKLSLEAGVKSLVVDYSISGYRGSSGAGTDYYAANGPRTITDSWKDNVLPQLGGVYKLTAHEQVFASYGENLARPEADGVYSTASYAGTSKVSAEKAKNIELGVRTIRESVSASLTLYKTSYKNRLQSFASQVEGTPLFETHYQNVGRIESQGVELSGVYRPAFLDKLALNGGATFNQSEFQNNYTVQSSSTAAPTTVLIAGKTTPDSPERMFQWGATYKPVDWSVVTLNGRYLSQRYSNFINTEWVPAYTVWSASVELGGAKTKVGVLKNVEIRFNVDNLFDKDTLGTISASTTGVGSFRPIPDRTYQLTVSAKF